MRFIYYSFILSLALIAAVSGGCKQDTRGKANPYYLRGLTLRQNDEFAKAAQSFEKCLRINPDAAEAHLQLGMLYEDHLESPVDAMFHYHKYLTHQPDGQNAEVVRESLMRLEKQMLIENLKDYPELVAQFSRKEELLAEIERLKIFRKSLIAQIRKQSVIIQKLRNDTQNEAKE